MLKASLLKYLTQPILGVALLTSVAFVCPPPTYAQRRAVYQGVDTNYTLGGGDRIKVTVVEVPEYSGEYTIPPGGGINLPLIGSVRIQGLTTEQAADLISGRYSRFLRRPLISVNLISPRPINVVVSGEVTRPGAYALSLQGGAGNDPGVQYPTVLSAITTAQGASYSADLERVQLRRGRRTLIVNLKQLTRRGTVPQDITLRDGDTIFVPTARSTNLADIREFATASFASDPAKPRTVAIVGEVNRPGSYLVTASGGGGEGGTGASFTGLPTITRAIQLAGGLTSLANIRGVQLVRRTKNGEQRIPINLLEVVRNGNVNQDTPLQEGDTIVIPVGNSLNLEEARLLSQVNLGADPTRPRTVAVVGEVTRPGTYLVTTGGAGDGATGATNVGIPNITRAIQLAGGLTSIANIQQVQLVRRTKTGAEKTLTVDLRRLLEGDVNQDTPLQDGDTIKILAGGSMNLAEARLLSQVNLAADPTRPRTVAVVGEVTRPGTYLVTTGGGGDGATGGTNVGIPNITRAIQLAGGLTSMANIQQVQLVRRTKTGAEQTIVVDLRRLLEGDVNQDTPLQDGDTIKILAGGSMNLAEARLLSQVNLAADLTKPRTVAIVGEVIRPGTYLVTTGGSTNEGTGATTTGIPNITRAIQLAGGLTSLANIEQVQLVRRTKTGEQRTIAVNLKTLLQGGDVDQDTLLQDGDTIKILPGDNISLADTRLLSYYNLAPDPTKPRAVAVIGEVNRPGTYLVSPGNTEQNAQNANTTNLGGGQPTVSRAIQLAGGITPTANVRDVKIRRATRDGKDRIINVDLFALLSTGDATQDQIIQEGDTVIISTATDVTAAEATQLATTTLAPGRILVGVVGEVKSPGRVELQPNSSLNQAILAAGGFNDARASRSTVDLVRLNPNGSVTKREIKIDFSQGINEQTNPILRNNDIVVINRSGLAKTGDTIGTVGGPLGTILSVLRFFGIGF